MGMIYRFRAALVGLGLLLPLPAAALDVQELTSPGGTPFWLVEEPSIPIVAVEISFGGGARLDPEGREGLAYLMAGLLEEGAGDRDAVAFAGARDVLSARYGFSANRDAIEVGARMLAETLEPSMDLLAEALTTPRFDPDAVERVRAQVLSSIASDSTDPDQVAARAWFARAFPDHPYGHPVDGTAASVAAITRDDLVAAHDRLLTRANARVALVGAIDAATAGAMVDRLLAGLPEGSALAPVLRLEPPKPGVEVIALDVPQSVALFGQLGLPREDPDFIPAFVMNYILGGGGFASRLMVEVREKRGLAYSVYSYLTNLDEAPLYMGGVQTANARMAESLQVIRDQWARMAADGVTEDELDAAKRYLTGAFPLNFDSNAKIANYMVFLQTEKLGLDYLDKRNKLIEAVTVEDIKRVAARLLQPDSLAIVVVGKPDGL